MIRIILAAALFLTACEMPPTPNTITIPNYLRSCNDPVMSPVPPSKEMRTIETIALWGNNSSMALLVAANRLKECDRRRAKAVEMLDNLSKN